MSHFEIKENMSEDEIRPEVVAIVKELVDEEEPSVDGNTNLRNDAGLDELDLADLYMSLEDTFDIIIDDEFDAGNGNVTVEDVVKVVKEKIDERNKRLEESRNAE